MEILSQQVELLHNHVIFLQKFLSADNFTLSLVDVELNQPFVRLFLYFSVGCNLVILFVSFVAAWSCAWSRSCSASWALRFASGTSTKFACAA